MTGASLWGKHISSGLPTESNTVINTIYRNPEKLPWSNEPGFLDGMVGEREREKRLASMREKEMNEKKRVTDSTRRQCT